jgi:integrase
MTAMASFRKKGKVWYYRFVNAEGAKRERRGCPDRRATEEMARAAESEAAKVRAGLIDPKARRLADAGRRPVREHLEDFLTTLASKGGDPKHVRSTRTYAARVLVLAKVERVSDLAPSAVARALAMLKDQDLSARTLNAHATAIKAFSRWLWRDGRSLDDPLASVGKVNEATDRRLVRRPLSDDELRMLINSTRSAPPWRGITGLDRATLYTIGAATGFRRSELASLRPDSFRLDAEPPTIVCEAAYTKNGQEAEQPIPNALAEALRLWLASRVPVRPVFDPLPEKTGQMLKADLRRAGIAPVDASGRVVDMHSLRHGYITSLARAGVPVKVLQTLARHSDPKLTLNVYAHLSVFDMVGALGALPDLTRPGPEPLAMTGTDPLVTPISDHLAPHLPTGADGSGRIVADADGMPTSPPVTSMDRKSLELEGLDAPGRDLSVSDGSAPRRTRTYNPLIKSQLLCQLS